MSQLRQKSCARAACIRNMRFELLGQIFSIKAEKITRASIKGRGILLHSAMKFGLISRRASLNKQFLIKARAPFCV